MHPITTRNRDIPVGQKPSGKAENPSGKVIPDGDQQESGDRKGRPFPSDGRQETFPDGNS